MGLNIENDRVLALAREAARRTGRSQTGVIEQALVCLLDDLDTTDPADPVERAREIAADFEARLSDVERARLDTDNLFDARGLPA